MTHASPLDPALVVLLDEIARDPKAKLFRTAIPRPERLVLAGIDPIGPAAARLTAAEHQLLRVYREETAKLLRDAAEWQLRQDPQGAAQVSDFVTPSFAEAEPDASVIAASLSRFCADRVTESVRVTARQGRALLESAATHASQFAGLALRLSSHDSAWIHIGRSLLLEGRVRPALEILAGVARRDQDARVRGSALSWIGAAYGVARLSAEAARAHQASAECVSPGPSELLSWFVESVLAGDYELARRAAAKIDPHLPPDSAGVLDWFAKSEARRRLDPLLVADERARRLMLQLEDKVGPTARMVIDAYS